ncbi:hypothetical protein D3C80_1943700 [compost metagenome]
MTLSAAESRLPLRWRKASLVEGPTFLLARNWSGRTHQGEVLAPLFAYQKKGVL